MENVNNEDPKLDNTITSPPPLEKAEEQPTTQTSIGIDRPNEKKEQNNNRENKPLSLFEALLLLIILVIPLINILFLLRWSFRKGVNRNKKNIARAFLIIVVLSFIFYYFGHATIENLL